jgi:hypothetical protein
MSPRRGSKPRRTDRLVVGRNVTLTLRFSDDGIIIGFSLVMELIIIQLLITEWTV